MKKLGLFGLFFAVACSSSTPSNPTTDGGTDAAADVPSTSFLQTGRVVDYDTAKGVKNVTVTATTSTGPFTATTDDTGKYSLVVPKNTPYTMSLTADKYLKLNEQEWSLTADANRGDTKFVSAATQGLLQAFLTGYDDTLAVVSVGFIKLPSCTASLDGMTVALENPGKSQVVYFVPGHLTPDGTSVTDGASPAVIFYNVTINAAIKPVVSNTTCKLAAFPQTDPAVPTISYSGNVVAEGGKAASFGRFFLE
ncbi:hypothetical protein BH09MYX1_BH09MYX1_40340 [soil metagenome]